MGRYQAFVRQLKLPYCRWAAFSFAFSTFLLYNLLKLFLFAPIVHVIFLKSINFEGKMVMAYENIIDNIFDSDFFLHSKV